MSDLCIVINQVHRGFAGKGAVLCNCLRGNSLGRRFFGVFLMDVVSVPASERRADELCGAEFGRCDLELAMRVVDVVGRSAIVEYRDSWHQGSQWTESAELQPESQPESAESLGTKALRLLVAGPMSKVDLSRDLGQKEVSGQLNKVVRQLIAEGMIEYTVPDKPRSRLQKYRITAKGMDAVATSNQRSTEP